MRVRAPGTGPDRGLRLALLLARVGEEGLSVESLLVALGCSRASLYRSIDRVREAGWPVETVREGERVLYRMGAFARQRPGRRAGASAEVLRLAREGASVGEIAEVVCWTAQSVATALSAFRRQGLLPPTTRVLSTTPVIEELARQGLTPREIAERTGEKPSAVSARLHRMRRDGTLPPAQAPGLRRGSRRSQIRDLVCTGRTPEQIAEHLGMSTARVRQAIRVLQKGGHLPPAPQDPPRAASSGPDPAGGDGGALEG